MSNLDAIERESLTVGSTDLVVKGGSVVKERVRKQWSKKGYVSDGFS
jgi:hypothetical protein